ncbi:nucleotide-sugar transporter [Coprinopsis cinerea okayama7|uniref:nucleotide-sugar transporter n=1 Tax=Coprinopsis cinerea (strain Okayama-7 / 130 / ATCC MYA-4618 / FGSC 9003) TaxID=240176 RepID=UPI0001D9C84A|nr:nucleotide-sugar transporter [Coprinopsis cinerea okayama7\|eukprot:XP_001831592.2 nucleotide-sugar transporter [Coprinopsis cinerea okayama7\
MSSSETKGRNEEDVAEIKKAIATGAVKDPSNLSAIPPIVCYCLASILMTVVNKARLWSMKEDVDMLISTIVRRIRSQLFDELPPAMHPIIRLLRLDFDMKDAKMWFPISFLLVSVIYTGSKSLQYLSIPVYTIFKNLTIILIAYGEVLWFGGRVTALTFVSFIFMVISSIIAAWSDVQSALASSIPGASSGVSVGAMQSLFGALRGLNVGYFWMLVNCLTSAAYVLSMRKRIKSTGFSDWDTMFYNNLLSIPVLAVFSLIAEDWGRENLNRNFPAETRNFLLFAIAFSGAAAVGISYTTAWCVRVTSSTTYSMVGALNKLPVAASGMLFFGDPVTVGSVSAVGVGFFAGIVYAVAKNNQKKNERRQAADAIIPMASRKP